MLNEHINTVNTKGMEVEPFNISFKKGQLYGKGSLDMKYGLSVAIEAIQSIIEFDIKLKLNL